MTSNIGAEGFKNKSLGFMKENNSMIEEIVINKLKQYFKPEFINRIDEIIPFASLSEESLKLIAEKNLNELSLRAENLGFRINYSNNVSKFIAEKSKIRGFGARPIIRIITNEIENKISSILISSNDKPTCFYVKVENDKINVMAEKTDFTPV